MQHTPTAPKTKPAPTPPRMSFDACMTAYDGRFAEWVDGVVEERDPLLTLMEIRILSAEATEQIQSLLRGDES